jgi:hypothetical protein
MLVNLVAFRLVYWLLLAFIRTNSRGRLQIWPHVGSAVTVVAPSAGWGELAASSTLDEHALGQAAR